MLLSCPAKKVTKESVSLSRLLLVLFLGKQEKYRCPSRIYFPLHSFLFYAILFPYLYDVRENHHEKDHIHRIYRRYRL